MAQKVGYDEQFAPILSDILSTHRDVALFTSTANIALPYKETILAAYEQAKEKLPAWWEKACKIIEEVSAYIQSHPEETDKNAQLLVISFRFPLLLYIITLPFFILKKELKELFTYTETTTKISLLCATWPQFSLGALPLIQCSIIASRNKYSDEDPIKITIGFLAMFVPLLTLLRRCSFLLLGKIPTVTEFFLSQKPKVEGEEKEGDVH